METIKIYAITETSARGEYTSTEKFIEDNTYVEGSVIESFFNENKAKEEFKKYSCYYNPFTNETTIYELECFTYEAEELKEEMESFETEEKFLKHFAAWRGCCDCEAIDYETTTAGFDKE